MKTRRALLETFLLLSTASFLCAQTPRYVVIDLGTLAGYAESAGSGINDAGEVAGSSLKTTYGLSRATLFRAGFAPLDLGTLGTASAGNGINISGKVAGYSITSNSGYRATLFQAGTAPLDLGDFGYDSFGSGINNAGQVAGYATTSGGRHAALFSAGGAPQDLGALTNSNSQAMGVAVNNIGQVAGYDRTSSGINHAVLFSTFSSPLDLGSLVASGSSFGSGINNVGLVTGSADTYSGRHAALFSTGSAPKDLGSLGGGFSTGNSINNSGQVVGSSFTPAGAFHAFLFLNHASESTADFDAKNWVKDLNKIINPEAAKPPYWVLGDAQGINDAGQITGQGVNKGNTRAYLATPFWRQVDATVPSRSNGWRPAVPDEWGNKKPSMNNAKSNMVATGCALCSAASMARSVIALKSKSLLLDIMTPALLDSLLTAKGADGYTREGTITVNGETTEITGNDLNWARLHTILKPYADISPVRTYHVTSATIEAMLTQQIGLGRRVILRFAETKTHLDDPNSDPEFGSHFVWVIGKDEAGDWKVGDGGWNNLTPQIGEGSAITIESLNEHIRVGGGFTTGTMKRTFKPSMIYAWENMGFIADGLSAAAPLAATKGASPAIQSGVAPSTIPNPLDGTTAAVTARAHGPVELVLTDPHGQRLGHDQATGNDYAEILNASYWTEDPILSASVDAPLATEGDTMKQLSVPSPVLGVYTVAATGTATGAASVTLEFIGPGGATKRVQANFNVNAGETSTYQITVASIGTADLALTQSIPPAQAKVGTPLTYTVTVTNNGGATAASPTFTDVLPDGVNFVSAVPSSGVCGLSGTVVGGVLGDLASGASATVAITVIPAAAGSISNSAHIAGFETDPDENNNAAVITTAVTTSVDDWRNLHFTPQELGEPAISGLTASANGDGVPNLVKYALGLNPKTSDRSGLPTAGTALDYTGTYFAFTYAIPPGVNDVIYTVEGSSNLAGWSGTGLTTASQVNNADGTQTVTVRDTVPMNQTTLRFMRLKITKP